MFGFAKQIFISAMMFFACNLPSLNSLKCISMNNQECKVKPKNVNVNSDEPVFFPFSIKISKCSGSCNNINDPYAKLFVPDVVKNSKVKSLFTDGCLLHPSMSNLNFQHNNVLLTK